jgi:putative ABC transport system permease protein
VIYFIVLQIVIWLGVDTDLLKLFQALIVAVFLAVPYWKGKHFNKGKKLAATAEKKEA